jgi:hypothetical protein
MKGAWSASRRCPWCCSAANSSARHVIGRSSTKLGIGVLRSSGPALRLADRSVLPRVPAPTTQGAAPRKRVTRRATPRPGAGRTLEPLVGRATNSTDVSAFRRTRCCALVSNRRVAQQDARLSKPTDRSLRDSIAGARVGSCWSISSKGASMDTSTPTVIFVHGAGAGGRLSMVGR